MNSKIKSKMAKKEKTNSILTGIAGEYFVAGELSRRGYIASITLRNTKGIDILASNKNRKRSVQIQVKSTTYDVCSWMLNKKAEDYYADNLFYIFVSNLKKIIERPNFYIVPSRIVAKYVKKNHKNWLKTLSKKGEKHKDSSVRKFTDKEKVYLENWKILNL